MHRNHNAVQAILACGLLGASYGALLGAVYGGILPVILSFTASHALFSALIGGLWSGNGPETCGTEAVIRWHWKRLWDTPT